MISSGYHSEEGYNNAPGLGAKCETEGAEP